ncbi:MAG: hypothetical protein JWQ32_966 [Marmoricola sp.]|nr:hypothetical protein [Marmoricola sp.]
MTSTNRFGRARSFRVAALTLVLATVATTGLIVSQGANAASPSSPPWQTGTGTSFQQTDPDEVGTLKFYDAAGTQIFGGSTTTAPFAAYVQSSVTIRGGDNRAELFAYQPNAGDYPGNWSGSLLSAASTYPVATPPGSVDAALPAVTGASGDTTLSDFLTAYPLTDTTSGYQGVLELRLRTGKAGADETSSTSYAVADIVVTGSTWEVYGTKADSTTNETVPASATYGAGFQVTASVVGAGATPTGTATLKDGSTTVGSAVGLDGSGAATFNVSGTALAAGVHNLTVTYSGDPAYNTSTSTSSPITIAKAATTTTSSVPTRATYGTAFHVTATIGGPGTRTGSATLTQGSTTLYTVNLVSGTASFTVAGTRLAPGTHPLTVTYNGSVSLLTSTSTSKSVVIGKAVGHAVNTLNPKTISHTKRAKLIVKVTATGVVPTGTVTIYDGTKVIGHATLSRGTVTFLLPRLRRGLHRIHVRYGGSAYVSAATAATVTLKST